MVVYSEGTKVEHEGVRMVAKTAALTVRQQAAKTAASWVGYSELSSAAKKVSCSADMMVVNSAALTAL